MDEQASPDPPPKKRHGCFYYGCLSTIVLAVVMGGCFFTLYLYGKSSVTPVVEEFLNSAESGNYDHAYSMGAPEWKEIVPRDDFPTLFQLVHDNLGARQSLSMQGIYVGAMTSGTTARAQYAATYDKGDADITVNLKKVDGEWQIVGVFYNSPKLANALKCPNCGAMNAIDAKFCAKCGKPLHAEKEKSATE
jgi:ribosomal protein L40E